MELEQQNDKQQAPMTSTRVHPVMGQPPLSQPPAYAGPGDAQVPAYLQSLLASGQLSGCVQTDTNGFPPNVVVVTQPAPGMTQPIKRPQDYLTLSLISIFFFFPMAICAIIYSCQSRVSAASGDYSRSLSEGRTARNLSIASIVLAIIVIIATVVPIVVISKDLS